jgi:hypothetical protein
MFSCLVIAAGQLFGRHCCVCSRSSGIWRRRNSARRPIDLERKVGKFGPGWARQGRASSRQTVMRCLGYRYHFGPFIASLLTQSTRRAIIISAVNATTVSSSHGVPFRRTLFRTGIPGGTAGLDLAIQLVRYFTSATRFKTIEGKEKYDNQQQETAGMGSGDRGYVPAGQGRVV